MTIENPEQPRNQERIENGVWRPGILVTQENEVGAGMSTKELKRIYGISGTVRLTGKRNRFDKSLTGQTPEERLEHFAAGRIISRLLQHIAPEADPHNIVKTALVHGKNVIEVNAQYLLQDRTKLARIEADGMITDLPGVPLMVAAADCAPVGIYDPETHSIGLFHSGWRGTLASVVPEGIRSMKNAFNTRTEDMRIFIGPYGGSTEYEVGKDVYEQFKKVSDSPPELDEPEPRYTDAELSAIFKPHPTKPDSYIFDNGLAMKIGLSKQGLRDEQIEISRHSTMNENGLFSSERVEGNEKRDSNIALLVLRQPKLKTRTFEGVEYPALQTGFVGAPIDKHIFLKGWDYVIDFEKSPTLQRFYEEFRKQIATERDEKKIIQALAEKIIQLFKISSIPAVRAFRGRYRGEHGPIMSLEAYAAAKTGHCSHFSNTFALIIERLQKEGLISGTASIEEAYWANEFTASGHNWATYQPKGADRLIIDITRNFVGSPQEYERILKSIENEALSDF